MKHALVLYINRNDLAVDTCAAYLPPVSRSDAVTIGPLVRFKTPARLASPCRLNLIAVITAFAGIFETALGVGWVIGVRIGAGPEFKVPVLAASRLVLAPAGVPVERLIG